MTKESGRQDFIELVREPREALDIEVKEWLDLTNNDHRATVAKAIIALANHGGGYLLIGFRELDDGTLEPAHPRPISLNGWSQDDIQSIVAKYVDPAIQCRVDHSDGQPAGKHPVIFVPGGHRIPVRAKAGSPDTKTLVPNRVYVRRAGPKSEEPRDTEEWDRLFQRCLQNRKEELLDSLRAIMAGELPTAASRMPTRLEELAKFQENARDRWQQRVSALPPDAPPRLANGYYDVAFAIDGDFERRSLAELREIIWTSVRNHSGWPPFLALNRRPYTPVPVDGAVECWIGRDLDGSYDIPARHDFWRISPDGFLFIRRGYQEDGGFYEMDPGKFLDITSPTWRVGEAILEASYIASALKGAEANLVCQCSWTGLAGRSLISRGNPNRVMLGDYTSSEGEFQKTETVRVAAVADSLPEIVFALLAPLYELFDFYKLPKRLVEEELAALRRNTFAM